jgi:hypothetical protein
VQGLRPTQHRLPRVAYGWKLQSIPDEAILRFARALARQAAREDHERDRVAFNQESGDLRPVLDRPAKREIDQITLCRGYGSREGIEIVEVYEDRARSGGSVMGRADCFIYWIKQEIGLSISWSNVGPSVRFARQKRPLHNRSLRESPARAFSCHPDRAQSRAVAECERANLSVLAKRHCH